jgi:hypothetical protein
MSGHCEADREVGDARRWVDPGSSAEAAANGRVDQTVTSFRTETLPVDTVTVPGPTRTNVFTTTVESTVAVDKGATADAGVAVFPLA